MDNVEEPADDLFTFLETFSHSTICPVGWIEYSERMIPNGFIVIVSDGVVIPGEGGKLNLPPGTVADGLVQVWEMEGKRPVFLAPSVIGLRDK